MYFSYTLSASYPPRPPSPLHLRHPFLFTLHRSRHLSSCCIALCLFGLPHGLHAPIRTACVTPIYLPHGCTIAMSIVPYTPYPWKPTSVLSVNASGCVVCCHPKCTYDRTMHGFSILSAISTAGVTIDMKWGEMKKAPTTRFVLSYRL